MRIGALDFRPSLLPSMAALALVVLTLSLGRWQLNRADEKRALERQYETMLSAPPAMLTGSETDSSALQFRLLTAAGTFDADKQIFIDNQVDGEIAGYHVLTPMKLDDGRHSVLVNRGWVARSADYPAPPQVSVPQGRVRIEGYGALPAKHFLELSSGTVQGKVWQNVTFDRYRLATGIDPTPIILVQTTGNAAGLKPVHLQPDFGINMHLGYAFQWFALSVAIIATYLIVNTRRVKQ